MSNDVERLMRKPLPNLDRWFELNGLDGKAPGFDEAMAGFADLAERTHQQKAAGNLTVGEECFLSMWKGFQIATIELCRIEYNKGTPIETIVASLPRVMACAGFYANVSIMKDSSPWRSVAKLMTEDFRMAANLVADAMEARS